MIVADYSLGCCLTYLDCYRFLIAPLGSEFIASIFNFNDKVVLHRVVDVFHSIDAQVIFFFSVISKVIIAKQNILHSLLYAFFISNE